MARNKPSLRCYDSYERSWGKESTFVGYAGHEKYRSALPIGTSWLSYVRIHRLLLCAMPKAASTHLP